MKYRITPKNQQLNQIPDTLHDIPHFSCRSHVKTFHEMKFIICRDFWRTFPLLNFRLLISRRPERNCQLMFACITGYKRLVFMDLELCVHHSRRDGKIIKIKVCLIDEEFLFLTQFEV